jgi:hypothetical protein
MQGLLDSGKSLVNGYIVDGSDAFSPFDATDQSFTNRAFPPTRSIEECIKSHLTTHSYDSDARVAEILQFTVRRSSARCSLGNRAVGPFDAAFGQRAVASHLRTQPEFGTLLHEQL